MTAAIMRTMPAAVRRVNASERAKTPMTTAVRGSRAPRMALRVGPMRLMAATRVMLETAVPSRAIPRILAQRKPSDKGTQRTPPKSMPMIVKLTAPKPITQTVRGRVDISRTRVLRTPMM